MPTTFKTESLDIEQIRNFKEKILIITGQQFQNPESAQTFVQTIRNHPTLNTFYIVDVSSSVALVIANAIKANKQIINLSIEKLTKETVNLLFTSVGENINMLACKTDAVVCEHLLDVIKNKKNITSLGFQRDNLNEAILKKLKDMQHVSQLTIQSPDKNTAALLSAHANLLAHIGIRITGNSDPETIKSLARIFKERLTSTNQQVSKTIKEVVDELLKEQKDKDQHKENCDIQDNTQSSVLSTTQPVNTSNSPEHRDRNKPLLANTSSSLVLTTSSTATSTIPKAIVISSTLQKEQTPIVDNAKGKSKKMSKNILVDLEKENNLYDPNLTKKFGIVFNIMRKLNRDTTLPDENEFEIQARRIGQATEKKYLKKHTKDLEAMQERCTDILNKFQAIANSNRKGNSNQSEKKASNKRTNTQELKIDHKRAKLSNASADAINDNNNELAEIVQELKKDNASAVKNLNSTMVELKDKVQNLPNLKVGLFKKNSTDIVIDLEENNSIIPR